MNEKKYLCSFADKRLKKSTERFEKQAKEMNIYDGIFLHNEDDLDTNFRSHFRDKFSKKGFGYWVWKPQIILQTLEKMEHGDVLQYTDIGCHLNKNGKQRLEQYFQMVNESEIGLLGFQMDTLKETQYTKGDLFDYFNARKNKSFHDGQIVGTVIFIRKCDKSMEILKELIKVFYDDFSLVDDSPSKSTNFPDFIVHRHDQSVWSLLAKTHNVQLLSHTEQYSQNWDELIDYPIWAKRDKEFKKTFKQTVKEKLINFRNFISSK